MSDIAPSFHEIGASTVPVERVAGTDEAVRVITGTGVPLRRADVDTDQIIPAEWLKRIERTGYEKGLFASWRDDRDFVLNDERFTGANVLVAGPAFGVGSSREHAVWALQQYGFDAVIAPSFSDIFHSNCTKNGLVPVGRPRGRRRAALGRHRGGPGSDDRRRRRTARRRGAEHRPRRCRSRSTRRRSTASSMDSTTSASRSATRTTSRPTRRPAPPG